LKLGEPDILPFIDPSGFWLHFDTVGTPGGGLETCFCCFVVGGGVACGGDPLSLAPIFPKRSPKEIVVLLFA
jgi:hypothetical protein